MTLEDVARAAGIRKPSLYYHFPEGKEQLFVAVQERMFGRIGDQLREVIEATPGPLEDRLNRAAEWFFARPPMFILSMIHHDMPAMSDHNRKRLTAISYGSIMEPLVDAVRHAVESGEIRPVEPHIVAGGFLSLLEGNTIAARAGFGTELAAMMRSSIDVLVHGLAPAEEDAPE